MNGWELSLRLCPAAKLTLCKLNVIVNLRGCYYSTSQLYQSENNMEVYFCMLPLQGRIN